MLEQTVSLESPAADLRETHGLVPWQLPAAWLVAGEPTVSEKSLGRSADEAVEARMRACTAGSFHWEYAAEEIIHVLEGFALVESAGLRRRLQPGDSLVFPAGSRFLWAVPEYIRMLVAAYRPQAKPRLSRRLYGYLSAPLTGRRPRRD